MNICKVGRYEREIWNSEAKLHVAYLVLVARKTLIALHAFQDAVRLDRLDARISLNIHALSWSVFDSDVKVVGNVEVLPRGVVVTGRDRDASAGGGVVSKVHTEHFIVSSVDHLDLGSAEVVVE